MPGSYEQTTVTEETIVNPETVTEDIIPENPEENPEIDPENTELTEEEQETKEGEEKEKEFSLDDLDLDRKSVV